MGILLFRKNVKVKPISYFRILSFERIKTSVVIECFSAVEDVFQNDV